jgi:tRNA-dihydrouridine synthase A
VQRGSFGACLMAEPERVAECVAAMRAAVAVPVTVKCRIGIDDSEELEFLLRFVTTVAAAGCRTFIVHARKAWLKGLSPKENREIPPLRYEVVAELKRRLPDLMIVLNGGLRDTGAIAHLAVLDGVMLGREAYENPWSLTAFEAALFGTAPPDRAAVLDAVLAYAARAHARGVPPRTIARHLHGLRNGLPGARAFRRRLAALRPDDGVEALRHALLGPAALPVAA